MQNIDRVLSSYTMAMTIMLALALGRIRAGQPEHLRSLVQPA